VYMFVSTCVLGTTQGSHEHGKGVPVSTNYGEFLYQLRKC
jgi:hypothetical protein